MTGYDFVKRLHDIIGGTLGILMNAILFPFIALAIKVASPGPVLFRVLRIGRHGDPFYAYKYRTMFVDAEARATGPVYGLRDDPRITPVGRFLRQTALDEFPLFYNVLRGEMSMVGPRAAFPLEVQRYTEEQKGRLAVRPGITGFWQVFGRESGVDGFDEMIEMDLHYIRNWSVWLDIKILFLTICVMLKRKAAY